jgi:hypothetical protein
MMCFPKKQEYMTSHLLNIPQNNAGRHSISLVKPPKGILPFTGGNGQYRFMFTNADEAKFTAAREAAMEKLRVEFDRAVLMLERVEPLREKALLAMEMAKDDVETQELIYDSFGAFADPVVTLIRGLEKTPKPLNLEDIKRFETGIKIYHEQLDIIWDTYKNAVANVNFVLETRQHSLDHHSDSFPSQEILSENVSKPSHPPYPEPVLPIQSQGLAVLLQKRPPEPIHVDTAKSQPFYPWSNPVSDNFFAKTKNPKEIVPSGGAKNVYEEIKLHQDDWFRNAKPSHPPYPEPVLPPDDGESIWASLLDTFSERISCFPFTAVMFRLLTEPTRSTVLKPGMFLLRLKIRNRLI